MKVTREMIGAAHDICLKKGGFVLSADLLERIYLAMTKASSVVECQQLDDAVNKGLTQAFNAGIEAAQGVCMDFQKQHDKIDNYGAALASRMEDLKK